MVIKMKRMQAVIMTLVVLLPVQHVVAESVRRGGGEGVNPALLQQVVAERDALRAKQDQLAADNERQAKELISAKASLAESAREIARLKAQVSSNTRAQMGETATAAKLQDTQRRLKSVVTKYKELVSVLRKSEERLALLDASAGQEGAHLKQCIKDNQALYTTTQALVKKYEDKGVLDAFLQHEPVTQLKRVEIETLGEFYRDQAEQHKFRRQGEVSESFP